MNDDMEDTAIGLTNPPVDDDLALAWRAYLDAWSRGHRRITQQKLDAFLTKVEVTTRAEAFAAWACHTLFDQSHWWSGQWGGGMLTRDGQFVKPTTPALSAYPILNRIMLPFLLRGLEPEDPTRLRWLCKFLIGQGYRIKPQDRHRLLDAITARYGEDTTAMRLLDRALELAPTDPLNRSLHEQFNADD